ncbi:Response regulatory protein [Caenispirillum salinarum AK4]|uniref:Response regulatory protein n=1 Tax=Caenispirillum salinarum AK4 TaxID=1238182 RepID=K9H5C8_9PROT|nr:PEP-CTERM-box response regulator transcription factor [Caenispirillum salinarum]EKV32767.1 Response regulatory protein [Caenispirillum salinarum AK4]
MSTTTDVKPILMLVEDDEGLAKQLRWALADRYDVHCAIDRAGAVALARRVEPAVVVLDLGLPPDPNGASEGLAVLTDLLAFKPWLKIIVSSGNAERIHALEAVRLGAYDIYPKPVDIDTLRLIVERASHLHALEDENRRLAASKDRRPMLDVLAESPKMLDVCRMIERVAPSDVNVLLTGESGTGKEVLARALHGASTRVDGPFVPINVAAIPETLLESELFGHEKGSFTGAHKTTLGKIEQADGGTLFLDEIGDMPHALQVKLLRFLQERVIERIGGRSQIAVDVRVVAATNRNLAEAIAEGAFREDLYYRLDEVGIHIPPLRERPGDATLLARHFLSRYAQEMKRPARGFTSDALRAIAAYEWPGNVRELENRVKRALVLADGSHITGTDLQLEEGSFPTLRMAREEAEYEAVSKALCVADNNVSAAAKLLGVSRPTLYDLMRSLKLRD